MRLFLQHLTVFIFPASHVSMGTKMTGKYYLSSEMINIFKVLKILPF